MDLQGLAKNEKITEQSEKVSTISEGELNL